MRVLVLFDLPVETTAQQRAYRAFRKLLISEGFIMMQESVYCKLVLNRTAEESVKERIRKGKPRIGLVEMMSITEMQYSRIEYLVGDKGGKVLDSADRVVVL